MQKASHGNQRKKEKRNKAKNQFLSLSPLFVLVRTLVFILAKIFGGIIFTTHFNLSLVVPI